MEDTMEGEAFQIFPHVVWGLILDRMKDPEDVRNLFKVYPELEAPFWKKRHLWILCKILPVITTWGNWIDEKDVLHCRTVCKPWSKDVDRFLESQPQFRAYNPELQSDEEFSLNSKAHLEKYRRKRRPDPRSVRSHYGGTKLQWHGDYNAINFVDQFQQLPPERNPFLSRSLSIDASDLFCKESDKDDGNGSHYKEGDKQNYPKDNLELVLWLLRKFGRQVWHYKISVKILNLEPPRVWEWLVESLKLLPNLKSLTVEDIYFDCDLSAEEAVSFLESGQVVFPPFPKLETLRIFHGLRAVGNCLINGLSTQIRRLTLPVAYWEEEYGTIFPNLAELKFERFQREDADNLTETLLSIKAPHLVKLHLDCRGWCRFSLENDIFKWLKHFSKIRYLDVGTDCGTWKSTDRGEEDVT